MAEEFAGVAGSLHRGGVKLRVQHLVDLIGFHAHHCGFFVDQTFIGHIHRDLDRSFGGAFTIAGLEHPQATLFNGELNVLHIVVVLFESGSDVP